jgi:hypothetical protein
LERRAKLIGRNLGSQKISKLNGGHRPMKVVALPRSTSMGAEVVTLVLRFYSFGNRKIIEALSHANDGANKSTIAGACADLTDERLVYFQNFDRKLPQVAKTGITGAKIIQRNLHTHIFQLTKHRNGKFGIVHQTTLGELKFKTAGFEFRGQFPETIFLPCLRLPACLICRINPLSSEMDMN